MPHQRRADLPNASRFAHERNVEDRREGQFDLRHTRHQRPFSEKSEGCRSTVEPTSLRFPW